jgi:hypothetical protein
VAPREGDALIEGITHRILAFLFLERHRDGRAPSDALRRFFYSFDAYATLVIWKVRPCAKLLPALLLYCNTNRCRCSGMVWLRLAGGGINIEHHHACLGLAWIWRGVGILAAFTSSLSADALCLFWQGTACRVK